LSRLKSQLKLSTGIFVHHEVEHESEDVAESLTTDKAFHCKIGKVLSSHFDLYLVIENHADEVENNCLKRISIFIFKDCRLVLLFWAFHHFSLNVLYGAQTLVNYEIANVLKSLNFFILSVFEQTPLLTGTDNFEVIESPTRSHRREELVDV